MDKRKKRTMPTRWRRLACDSIGVADCSTVIFNLDFSYTNAYGDVSLTGPLLTEGFTRAHHLRSDDRAGNAAVVAENATWKRNPLYLAGGTRTSKKRKTKNRDPVVKPSPKNVAVVAKNVASRKTRKRSPRPEGPVVRGDRGPWVPRAGLASGPAPRSDALF